MRPLARSLGWPLDKVSTVYCVGLSKGKRVAKYSLERVNLEKDILIALICISERLIKGSNTFQIRFLSRNLGSYRALRCLQEISFDFNRGLLNIRI